MILKPLYDCVLVSAFGRSELLALELAQRGFRVAILDVTNSFKSLGISLRDVEGPFPMVTPSPSFPSHLDWMIAHSSGELDRGFSIWLKEGPVEMRGPLSGFYSERDMSVGFLKEYLAKKMQAYSPKSLFKKLYSGLSFEDSWLIHLSHSLAYCEMLMHKQSGFYGEPFPLNQSSQLLRLSDSSLADLKGSAIHAGVDYIEAKMESLQVEKKELKSIRLDNHQELRSLFFGWSLSQEETHFLSEKVFNELFSKTTPQLSDWRWQRLSLITDQEHFVAMPDSFLMVENPEWFWSGENFVLFKRVNEKSWDLWIRVPRNYPSTGRIVDKIRHYLEDRIGEFDGEIEWIHQPDEVCFFPIFEKGQRRHLKKPVFKNLIYEGSDQFERLDLSYRFEMQVASLAKFEVMKQRQEKLAQKKGGSVDHQIHSP